MTKFFGLQRPVTAKTDDLILVELDKKQESLVGIHHSDLLNLLVSKTKEHLSVFKQSILTTYS